MANRLVDKIIDRLAQTTAGAQIEGQSTAFGERISGTLYRYLNHRLRNVPEITFMNYGFAPLDDQHIPLLEQDEPNRVYIQLYQRVAGAVDLAGRRVLEMSCGRGGGASYLSRTFKPRSYLGIDRSPMAVIFCRRRHARDGLQFACGDALNIPVADDSVDAVVNIEASIDYPDFPRFLAEVSRILRPGGHLLYADFRRSEHCAAWRRQLGSTDLTIADEEDITANVVRGLERNSAYSLSLVRRHMPLLFKPLFREFTGAQGSFIHRSLASGKQRYLRFVLRNTG